MANVEVKWRWHPQYKPSATGKHVTGYRVHAYVGHPLLGTVRGSEHVVKTKAAAQKLATQMRKRGGQAQAKRR